MTTAAYRPYEPLNTLKPIGEDIWIVDGPEIRFRLALLRIPFPTRMTVIRLPGGSLWIHSPIALTEPLVEELRQLGPVAHLVAPNSIHYWWVGEWQTRFPGAEVWAAPHLDSKAAGRMPPHHELDRDPPAPWAGTIEQALIRGTRITELAFFHRQSRTLIIADLIENFETGRFRSVFYKLLSRIGGTVDPDGRAPLELRRTFRRDELRAAVRQMIAWEPQRIVIAHGRWYRENAPAELRRAFRWV